MRKIDGLGRIPDRVVYRAQQASLLHAFLALHRRIGILRDHSETDVDFEILSSAWRRYAALLERDLANAHAGLYPRALLFGMPWKSYARAIPELIRNSSAVLMRRLAGDTADLPEDVELGPYPTYYRQNFHWQTDGYLSRRSAELYDIEVEMMFFGTADVMRRQVIPPITRHLAASPGSGAKLLDVGCGTGRTLLQLAAAHPGLCLTGLDLSPFYLEVARDFLAEHPRADFVAGNAESLPFSDETFDVVTSTFVMHELPRDVRRTVLAEMRRVLRPGGLLLIEDSAQLREAGDLEIFMHHFAQDLHEPYFEDYLTDDLEDLLESCGFGVEGVESHFLAKVVTSRRSA